MYGWLQVKCHRCETEASLPLDAIRRPRDTPLWKLEASLKCRSCRKGRYAPPVHMVKLTERCEITPYRLAHPNDDESAVEIKAAQRVDREACPDNFARYADRKALARISWVASTRRVLTERRRGSRQPLGWATVYSPKGTRSRAFSLIVRKLRRLTRLGLLSIDGFKIHDMLRMWLCF